MNSPKSNSVLPPATAETPTVIGLGTFGKPLSLYLERKLEPEQEDRPRHLDKNPALDPEADGTVDNVAARIIQDNPSHLIMAIGANEQATEGVEIIRRWLAETPADPDRIKIALQINSVQSTVRNAIREGIGGIVPQSPVAVVSIHPYHGAVNFADPEKQTPEKPKTWILTGIDVFNPDKGQTEDAENTSMIAYDYIDTLVARLRDVTLVDLSDGHKMEDGTELNGSEYHDYIAAYYQAVFHMVRLTPGIEQSEWYEQNFAHVKASPELSVAIIADNPYALIVAGRYNEYLGGDYTVENVLAVANRLILEGENCIASQHRALKTANVAKLQEISCS